MVLEELLELTMKALGSSIGYVLLYDQCRKNFLVRAHRNHSGKSSIKTEIPLLSQSVSTWVLKTRKPVIIRNMDQTTKSSKRSILGNEHQSLLCVPLILCEEMIGTMLVVNKIDGSTYSTEDMELLLTVATHACLAIKSARLHKEQNTVCMNIIHSLVSLIDASDRYTRAHSFRVGSYALGLANSIDLPVERIEILERAAILHDIGKIGVNGYLLNKDQQLTTNEIYSLQQHPLIGMKILEPFDFLKDVRKCIGQHHERVDGLGYPFGIPARHLLVESRILAIADAFDAMTSDRPYRKAMGREEALQELADNAGKQHDAGLVAQFIRLVRKGAFDFEGLTETWANPGKQSAQG